MIDHHRALAISVSHLVKAVRDSPKSMIMLGMSDKPDKGKRRAGWSDRAAQWKEQAQGAVEKTTDAYKKTADTYKQSQLPAGHDAEIHGPSVAKAEVGMKTLELFERGYLSTSGGLVTQGAFGLGKSKGNFERIISIKYRESTNTFNRDQSIVGSAITNAVTLGMGSTESVKTQTTGTITVNTEANVYSGTINAKHGRIFEAYGERWFGAGQPPPAPAAPAQPDIADQIKKLAELNTAGILTDEEFATKKAQLLDRM